MGKTTLWKSLRKEMNVNDILDGLFGAIVLATLIFLPVFLISIELITVYMYRLTILVILIIIALFGYSSTIYYFWRKSLLLKKEDIKTDTRKMFKKFNLITCSVILLLGLIFIFLLIPILWV